MKRPRSSFPEIVLILALMNLVCQMVVDLCLLLHMDYLP